MNTRSTPSFRRAATLALTLAAASALGACGETKPVGSVGYVKGFGGIAVADEPRAATVARDVLSAGGSAADAAVAMYFTMAVTMPSTASLGGGGTCVVHDRDKKKTEVVEFIAPPSAAQGRMATAVPANVRGFYALHAKYGRLRWESLLGEAERLARFGVPVSRAFAADLARAGQALAADPAARAVFLPGNKVPVEGQVLEQHDLAAVISRVRRAPGEFYVGVAARDFAAAATRAGATLTPEDLRDLKPLYRDALTVKVGDEVAHFAPPPAVEGAVAAQIVAALADRWSRAGADERPHLLAEAAARAFADRRNWMQPHGWPNERAGNLVAKERVAALMAGLDSGRHAPVQADKPTEALPAASLVALDSYGGAVACNVTAYGLFGAGKVAPGTGVVLAAAPGPAGPPALGPVLVVNHNSNEVRLGAAASGGVTAPTALAQAVLSTHVEGRKLEEALASPRVHHSGQPDFVAVESGEFAADPAPLAARGHEVKTTQMPSRVNAFACGSGRASFTNCRAASDPRGFGMATVVGKD
ncbi:gamma-glutamyltransferase [Magnetospirillum sp. UT-4]|uniref:gamma-glutamyltransferase n=1 Tax=Magnetospirillum sp. UT-4 TaxID=2681467 RepID=UPI0013824B4B|nr:gamma-glutamyltransferase [Magnetospirillum sp. UT-4]CAA7618160.1 Gamma-glutamyltransferase [Magnetospirillum sp. UT-4]